MPTSAQSALSASASVWEDASDCDREPARDNVFPCDVDDHRRASTHTGRLHRNAGPVDRNQLTLDQRLRVTAAVADVDTLAVAPIVFEVLDQRLSRARRGRL